jgi:hypothetical protein
MRSGLHTGKTLLDAALLASWATPRAAELAAWPTTTKEDARSSRRHGYMITGQQGTTLYDAALLASWATPKTHDAHGTDFTRYSKDGIKKGRSQELNDQAQLATWPTPTGPAPHDTETTAGRARPRPGYGVDLPIAAHLAGWPSPMAGTPSNARYSGTTDGESARMTRDLVIGPRPSTGSPASTAKRGRLNPAHSRWLMQYPRVWDVCAATAMPSSRRSPPK